MNARVSTLCSILAVVLAKRLIVLGEGHAEDDRRDAVEAVNPLPVYVAMHPVTKMKRV